MRELPASLIEQDQRHDPLGSACFPTLGWVRGEDVQPHHYSTEAHYLAAAARDVAGVDPREARELRAIAEHFHSIAVKHSWHPSALRSMAMRSEMRKRA